MCSACLTRHGDGWDVHGHPTLPWGRSRSSSPLREGYRRAETGRVPRLVSQPECWPRQTWFSYASFAAPACVLTVLGSGGQLTTRRIPRGRTLARNQVER